MKKLLLSLILLTSACGNNVQFTSSLIPPPVINEPGLDGVVIRARAYFYYSNFYLTPIAKLFQNLLSPFINIAYAANPSNQPVSVVLAPNVTMAMSNTNFITPTISNAVLNFGHLDITSLQDNDLKHCGGGGNSKCNTALFRIYTTGAAGAGFWNSTDVYGAPMTGGLNGGTLSTVGLNVAGALTVQTWIIPNNRHTVNLSDFAPVPNYEFKGDFTDAGAGTYATTVTIEFALAP